MNLTSAYATKNGEYFGRIRHEIFQLLPENTDRILDVGCGSGATLCEIKASRRCLWAGGVELFPESAKEARGRLDMIYEGNIETMVLPVAPSSLDVILCLDILEHLVDPWHVVSELHRLLRPGGVLIASIPNARNHRVVLPLLFGRWDYTHVGLLDKTHLRFFVRATAIELVESAGLRVDRVLSVCNGRAKIANALTLSIFRPFLEFQYLIRAKRLD